MAEKTITHCWCVIVFSAIIYILRNSGFPTYLNHYSLDHQCQYSLPLQCHHLMKSIPSEMINLILGIVLCYQDQLIIWLWISLSLWNNRIPYPFLLCCCLQEKGYDDKGRVFSVEHRSSPKIYVLLKIFFPCLRTLRLANSNKSGMEKIFYYSLMTKIPITKSSYDLDNKELFPLSASSSKKVWISSDSDTEDEDNIDTDGPESSDSDTL